jgi:hypothetical protein
LITGISGERRTRKAACSWKAGQYPELETRVPPDFVLTDADKLLYRRALNCRHFSFGLGAVAYLRRIVENQMNQLLNLLEERAKIEGSDGSLIEQVRAARGSRSTYEEKLEVAVKALPTELTRSGHNPLRLLTGFTSYGLHNETEEECIQRFDDVQWVFEDLMRSLRRGNQEAVERANRYGKLAQRLGETRGSDS